MIRIIAGRYKGRFLKAPSSKNTRPTTDKVRQAIFSAIKNQVENRICLDLFAGSGAFGIEALSRGAGFVYFIEKDHNTFKTLKENVYSVEDDASRFSLSNTDYRLFLKRQNDIRFDIVFLDPPYRYKINEDIIAYLEERNLLSSEAVIVSEQDHPSPEIEGFSLKNHRYGATHVGIYTKEDI